MESWKVIRLYFPTWCCLPSSSLPLLLVRPASLRPLGQGDLLSQMLGASALCLHEESTSIVCQPTLPPPLHYFLLYCYVILFPACVARKWTSSTTQWLVAPIRSEWWPIFGRKYLFDSRIEESSTYIIILPALHSVITLRFLLTHLPAPKLLYDSY